MGLIKVGSHVDLDFDHQFIPAHKFDAKYSYKQDFGYFPGWASIGGIIVGGENRDGNTNVRFHQEDTLRRIMDRVTSELGVVIERFRADSGCRRFTASRRWRCLIGHDERPSGLDDLAHLAVEVFDGTAAIVINSYHGQTICCS